MASVAQYIQSLLQVGRYHFAIEDAVSSLSKKREATVRALSRLRAKGELAIPQRGFYVIIPPEYRALGCLPAEQFVPQLMEHRRQPYYAALLSAAQLHGAAHQKPQCFQVMVGKPLPVISCGLVQVVFHVRARVEHVGTSAMNTPRGQILVSSPEATGLDLVGYVKHAGGLDNVATVLSELAELMTSNKLVDEARMAPISWSQRLGYLLEKLGYARVARDLKGYVAEHAQRVTPLESHAPRTGAERANDWKVAITRKVEPDL